MTFAAVPLLQREPAGVVDFGGDWLPALYSREFDGADAPLTAKRGALIGMGLTESRAVRTCAPSARGRRRWARRARLRLSAGGPQMVLFGAA